MHFFLKKAGVVVIFDNDSKYLEECKCQNSEISIIYNALKKTGFVGRFLPQNILKRKLTSINIFRLLHYEFHER